MKYVTYVRRHKHTKRYILHISYAKYKRHQRHYQWLKPCSCSVGFQNPSRVTSYEQRSRHRIAYRPLLSLLLMLMLMLVVWCLEFLVFIVFFVFVVVVVGGVVVVVAVVVVAVAVAVAVVVAADADADVDAVAVAVVVVVVVVVVVNAVVIIVVFVVAVACWLFPVILSWCYIHVFWRFLPEGFTALRLKLANCGLAKLKVSSWENQTRLRNLPEFSGFTIYYLLTYLFTCLRWRLSLFVFDLHLKLIELRSCLYSGMTARQKKSMRKVKHSIIIFYILKIIHLRRTAWIRTSPGDRDLYISCP